MIFSKNLNNIRCKQRRRYLSFPTWDVADVSLECILLRKLVRMGRRWARRLDIRPDLTWICLQQLDRFLLNLNHGAQVSLFFQRDPIYTAKLADEPQPGYGLIGQWAMLCLRVADDQKQIVHFSNPRSIAKMSPPPRGRPFRVYDAILHVRFHFEVEVVQVFTLYYAAESSSTRSWRSGPPRPGPFPSASHLSSGRPAIGPR